MPVGPRPLCLVGMSGSGKSYWARALSRIGFSHHDCDAAIAHHLGDHIDLEGQEPVYALATWMGMPFDAGYAEREAKYLELEEKMTRAALEDCLSMSGVHILDTTGSVVHLSQELRDRIHATCHVVALLGGESSLELLRQRYLKKPKPVVFDSHFRRLDGESDQEALHRSYGELLDHRRELYRAMSHVVIDTAVLERDRPNVHEFLSMLQMPELHGG